MIPDSYLTLAAFAQHYRHDARVIRTDRNMNLATFSLGDFHLEAANADSDPTVRCTLSHRGTQHVTAKIEDTNALHTIIDTAINTLKEIEND